MLHLVPFEGSSGLPPPAQPFGCLQTAFLWIAVADSAALLSTTFHHSPSLTGWSTHLAPGCTWLSSIRSWRPGGDRFRVPRVPLTREPTRTQAIDLGASRSTLTPADTSRPSRSPGHFPDFPWSGSPWLAHGSPLHGDRFPNPMGLLFGALCRSRFPAPLSQPRDAPFPCATPRPRPNPLTLFPYSLCVFIPYRAASNPLARARRTVLCLSQWLPLLRHLCLSAPTRRARPGLLRVFIPHRAAGNPSAERGRRR